LFLFDVREVEILLQIKYKKTGD